jgi:hypothetical protein
MAVRIRRIGIHFDFHIGIIHALFILSNETVINSNPICVSELGAHAASQKRSREPFPNFHQGQVLPRITASRPADQRYG